MARTLAYHSDKSVIKGELKILSFLIFNQNLDILTLLTFPGTCQHYTVIPTFQMISR